MWLRACVLAGIFVGVLNLLATESVMAAAPECGAPSDIHDGWTLATPQEQGIDPALLCAMGRGVSDRKLADVDSIVVIRHGRLVYERYFTLPGPTPTFDPATMRHAGHSMTKSVVSLLVGIALDRGWIGDIDAPVFSYFPEYAAARSPEKDRISLRNLLTMSDGLNSATFFQPGEHRADPEPYRFILGTRLVREPGASFEYNSATTELIGGVLQKVSGKTVDVLAKELIFAPLGITDVEWGTRLGNGFATASSGLSLRPRDWAKLGQLVLDHGVWEGKQIVPASWIAQSTAPHIKAQKQYSYGFQWWVGQSTVAGRVIAWSAALGYNSQKVIVIPELDLVVVFNASRESVHMIAPELDLLDQHILPAVLNR